MKRDKQRLAGGPRITPAKARNALGVARTLAPALVPVLAPMALRAASAAREGYDRYRARRLGVHIDRLGEYTGRGARLHARIAGLAQELAALRAGAAPSNGAHDEEAIAFTEQAQAMLLQLAAAVRAAERMPATRRRATHQAAASELDTLEDRLLGYLGLARTGSTRQSDPG